MKKGSCVYAFLCSCVLMFLCGLAFGEEQTAVTLTAGGEDFLSKSVVVAVIGLTLVAIAGAIGQSIVISKALEGIARQPEARGHLQLNMIIGLAFIESLVLYMLFIAIVLLFANPFLK